MATISKLIPLLRKTGLSENESQEFIEIVEDSFLKNLVTKDDIKNLSTKEDLHNLAISTKEDINNLAISTKEDIKDIEIRLIKWVIGLLFAQTGIIIAIIKLF
jgi:hypothetical protein